MAWTPNLAFRISADDIDEDLTNFPVTLHLDSDHHPALFNELSGGSSDRLKMQALDSSLSELYTEVEEFSTTKAVLHISGPAWVISSSADTVFYLCFDSSEADNTTYVGDPGSTAAQSVWDSDFAGVWHLSEDPTGGSGCIKDSTSNNNDGTPQGTMTSGDLVDVGNVKGLDFDGTDDWIDLGDVTSADGATELTVEVYTNRDTDVPDGALLRKWYSGAWAYSFGAYDVVESPEEIKLMVSDDTNYTVAYTTDGSVGTGELHYLVGVWAGGTTAKLYQDAVSKTVAYKHQTAPSAIVNTAEHLGIGARYNNGSTDLFYDGQIAELRLSTIERSAAWISATYDSLLDNLATYVPETTDSALFMAFCF